MPWGLGSQTRCIAFGALLQSRGILTTTPRAVNRFHAETCKETTTSRVATRFCTTCIAMGTYAEPPRSRAHLRSKPPRKIRAIPQRSYGTCRADQTIELSTMAPAVAPSSVPAPAREMSRIDPQSPPFCPPEEKTSSLLQDPSAATPSRIPYDASHHPWRLQ